MQLYPLKLKPVYKDYVWGGDRIVRKFNRDVPPGIYAESWELSARPEGMSLVENGSLKGEDIESLLRSFGESLLGSELEADSFPLLVKLIGAEQDLSLQVHPHDVNARRTGAEAKTEMWHVLDADPGAELIVGLKPGFEREDFSRALASGKVEPMLNRIAVKPGDTIYMPGGRVHAICAGTLILEVQQNSNTTYRLHDWGRVGNDGKPRELHIEQGLDAVCMYDNDPVLIDPKLLERDGENEIWRLADTPYFVVDRLMLAEKMESRTKPERFSVIFCAEGSIEISGGGEVVSAESGTTTLLPSAMGDYTIEPVEGKAAAIRIAPEIHTELYNLLASVDKGELCSRLNCFG